MAHGFTTQGGIRFEPVPGEPGDYDAEAGGIKFSIVKSTDAGFGISAYKNGKSILEPYSGVISWRRARKRCAEYADLLLRTHGENLTVAQHAAKLAFLGDSLPLTPGFHDFLEAEGLMDVLEEKH